MVDLDSGEAGVIVCVFGVVFVFGGLTRKDSKCIYARFADTMLVTKPDHFE